MGGWDELKSAKGQFCLSPVLVRAERSDDVRDLQADSGGFRRIQADSGGFRRIQADSGGFRRIQADPEVREQFLAIQLLALEVKPAA